MSRSPLVRRARRPVAAVTCVLFLALSGCYAYSPVDEGAPEAGSEVRLRLDDEAAERVAAQTVLGRRDVVEGRLLEPRASELRMLVSRPARRDFAPGGRAQDTVLVPRSGVESVELKELETGKTALLFGGVTAGAVLLGVAVLNSAGGGGLPDGGNGGQPLDISIPISVP